MNFKDRFLKRNKVEDWPSVLKISEAGKYSYAAICALSLNHLFNSEWDKTYMTVLNTDFVNHLGLPKQVHDTMECLLQGQHEQSYQAYVEMLLAEPFVITNHIAIIQDMLMFSIKTGHYDARSRELVMHVAALIGAPKSLVQLTEEELGHCLHLSAKKETTPEQELNEQKIQRKRKFKRAVLVGVAALGGGALIGLTGGLAAPFIGAGIGAVVGGSALATALGTVAGAAILGSLFGIAGAGLTGYRMNRRVGEIEEFEFGYLSDPEEKEKQLHIVIAISGWLNTGDANFCYPWRTLRASKEQYFLRYESRYLRELGNAMDMLVAAAMKSALQEALKHTAFKVLLAAVAWPAALMSLSNVIDNPWSTCLRRSAQVGRHLAEVLLTREHGERPVTLVGFSLGARVIFYCLRELADRRPGSEGIIHDAVMLGTPVTGSTADWEDICTVVGGKIINGYCRNDWMLKFLYRTTNAVITIAGLDEVECKSQRLKNIDLTEFVNGHMEYSTNIDTLLKVVGIKTVEPSVLILKKSYSETAMGSSEERPVIKSSASLPVIVDQVEEAVEADADEADA